LERRKDGQYRVSAPCDPHQRQGYWLENRFTRSSQKKEAQFAYTRMYIECEAVLSALNFSDLRQNSNVAQRRIEAFYNWPPNVVLGLTDLFRRPPDSTEPYLKRFQFDVAYKF
jgi:hypothetical protein